MGTASIVIDLDLHKAIEQQRRSLDESQTEIVRRVMNAHNGGGVGMPAASLAPPEAPMPKRRLSRRGGEYRLRMLGTLIEANSLKEVLKQAILLAEDKTSGFVERLAMHRTSRGRRIVARKPEELYPGRPLLISHAERLDSKWWYDTNISNGQCRRYLRVLSEIGGFPEPQFED